MKLKFIYILTLMVLGFVSFGQTKSKLIVNKTPLDLNAIEYILIRNHSGKSDTVKTIYKQLDYAQCKLFVKKFNNAKSSGPYKFIVEYWVDVKFRDGTTRVFRGNSNHLKENSDNTFDLGDKKYLETLWKTTKAIKQ